LQKYHALIKIIIKILGFPVKPFSWHNRHHYQLAIRLVRGVSRKKIFGEGGGGVIVETFLYIWENLGGSSYKPLAK